VGVRPQQPVPAKESAQGGTAKGRAVLWWWPTRPEFFPGIGDATFFYQTPRREAEASGDVPPSLLFHLRTDECAIGL